MAFSKGPREQVTLGGPDAQKWRQAKDTVTNETSMSLRSENLGRRDFRTSNRVGSTAGSSRSTNKQILGMLEKIHGGTVKSNSHLRNSHANMSSSSKSYTQVKQ